MVSSDIASSSLDRHDDLNLFLSGEFLYVSTLDLVAQYSVQDLRRSFGCAAMR